MTRALTLGRNVSQAEESMNEDTFKGQWTELKGKIRQQWGKLTDDDMQQIQGDREVLLGKLQQYYGRSREEMEKDYERWIESQHTKI
jgi:uncharacterized protein YjbJ (UPF0337 family)